MPRAERAVVAAPRGFFPEPGAAAAAALPEPLREAHKDATYRSGHASSAELQNPSLDFGSQLKTTFFAVKTLRRNLRWF